MSEYEIWCDKPSDRELVLALKQISPFLSKIESINVLPSRVYGTGIPDGIKYVFPLVEYDRPDIMIFYHKQPILVVELTEHGYTGDNPLQRFARAVRAAELKVPFIHFTPFARTRLDEILYSDRTTSSRRVSSRLFEGFMKLTHTYGVPVIALHWSVNDRGTAVKANLNHPGELKNVYGELVELIEEICSKHSDEILVNTDIRQDPVIKKQIENNERLAADSNTLDSEIRLDNLNYETILQIINQPNHIINLMGKDYFFKGKDHKLIAFAALNDSRIAYIETSTGGIVRNPAEIGQIRKLLPDEFSEKPWFLLYSGYEWRGEPNGGIAANAEILHCRSEGGLSITDKDKFFVAIWPRVFLNPNSPTRKHLLDELHGAVQQDSASNIYKLIASKRKAQDDTTEGTYIAYSNKSYGVWQERSTIARIYRSFCDLIILNDAILLGYHRFSIENPQQVLIDRKITNKGQDSNQLNLFG